MVTLSALACGATMLCREKSADRGCGLALLEQAHTALWPCDMLPAAVPEGAPLDELFCQAGVHVAAAAAILGVPPLPSAAALAATLERHCPEISLSDLHTWALVSHGAACTHRLRDLQGQATPEVLATLIERIAMHILLLHQCGGPAARGISYAFASWAMHNIQRCRFSTAYQLLQDRIAWAKGQQREWRRLQIDSGWPCFCRCPAA